ncbi:MULTISPECIES: serine/threonine protein kinase [Kitasatospora]|uniref:Protein kinase domain-containing protein n=1 Tax=Kitasatospora cystarginea TaxID=58350 RepID=A0ABN3DET8_9ACTN
MPEASGQDRTLPGQSVPGQQMPGWRVPGTTEIRPLGTGPCRVVLVRSDATGALAVVKYLLAAPAGGTALRHPNLVRIDQVLPSPDGEGVAVVMAAVEGASLQALLAVRRLPPEAGLAVLRDSLLGLAAAHEQGVVHGSYRPSDVLVDLTGHCQVLNTGRPAAAATADLSETDAAYRAPELRRGEPASPASDGYAAALVFLECLTGGQPATVGHSPGAAAPDDLPEPLRRVVVRATAEAPEARYPDARSFLAELEAAAAEVHGPQWPERGERLLADAAAATASAQPLLGPDGPGAGPWWRRRRSRLAVAGAVVMAVLAVVLVLLLDGGSPKQEVREPFTQALAALARTPGVRYQDHDQYTGYYDVTVTAAAERFGSVGEAADFSDKVDEDLVTVAGHDYLSYRNDTALKGWTYDPGNDEKNMASLLKTYVTPAQLAATLSSALDQQPRLPVVGDKAAAAVTVDGQPAWRADTVQGYLYVTQKAPYRVLRWEPANLITALAGLKAMAKNPSSQQPRSLEAHTPLTNSLGITLTPVTDAAGLYGKVVQYTKELTTATTGASVQILQQNDGASNVACSHTGCLVNVAFSGPVYNASSAAYVLDKVYIELKVGSITTGGREVGGCTSGLQPYQLTGTSLSGKLTCNNPAGGPLFDQAAAENQARANASGSSQFWDYADRLDLVVHPLSPTDVDQLVAKEQHELQSLG